MSIRAWMPNFLWSIKMAASSVTGVGPGESFGKYKPQNGCGCGGGNSTNVAVQSSTVKKSCHIRYNSCNNDKINISKGINSIEIC